MQKILNCTKRDLVLLREKVFKATIPARFIGRSLPRPRLRPILLPPDA